MIKKNETYKKKKEAENKKVWLIAWCLKLFYILLESLKYYIFLVKLI